VCCTVKDKRQSQDNPDKGRSTDKAQRENKRIKKVPVAERFKPRIYDRSLTEVAGSNPGGGIDVCVVCVLYSKDKRQNQDK
jgi:hypothetical protein